MREILKYFILLSVMLIVTLFLIELAFRLLVFRPDSDFQKTYLSITNPKTVVPYCSQPYLNYINTPFLRDKDDNLEINSMGIRYPCEISLKKPDSTLRIMFLGGSTTFGEIDLPYNAFPSMIEKELTKTFLPTQKKYNKIECLNGGVHGLTTAEILNHFQFKYQYLQPDIVVLHTGVNDAFAYAKIHDATYQPDYHNIRRVFYDVHLPTQFERKLLHSKIYAYYLINTRLKDFMNNNLEDNIFYFHSNNMLWFKPGNDAITDTTYNAFYNNIKTLYGISASRAAKLLIVPEVIDTTKMPAGLNEILLSGLNLNKRLLTQLSNAYPKIVVRELPEQEFTPSHFMQTDGIHTNENGEKLKTKYISQFIIEMLNNEH